MIIDGHSEEAENIFREVRARFDSMADEERETFLEAARRLLPPSCHQDQDTVLVTALHLYHEAEARKETFA
jgi:hypothetical protein